jgi:hypothetical protein
MFTGMSRVLGPEVRKRTEFMISSAVAAVGNGKKKNEAKVMIRMK